MPLVDFNTLSRKKRPKIAFIRIFFSSTLQALDSSFLKMRSKAASDLMLDVPANSPAALGSSAYWSSSFVIVIPAK
eukprot:Skav235962  [mRNA]  locus=scaffold592:90966:92011:+ [translate_table: standard]